MTIFSVCHVHAQRMAESDAGARVNSGFQFSCFFFVG